MEASSLADRAWVARTRAWFVRFAFAYLGIILGVYAPWCVYPLIRGALEFTGFNPSAFFNALQRLTDATPPLVFVCVAAIVAVAWSARDRGAAVSPRVSEVARVAARYFLALTLLSYGWIKIFPLQMECPGPLTLMKTYGESSAMTLAWTFFGARPGYEIMCGVAEALTAYLLLWRRTSLLGALLAAGVMTNVAAINYFYDVPVLHFASHLMLMALFIAAFDLPRLANLFLWNRTAAPAEVSSLWTLSDQRRRQLAIAHVLFVVLSTAAFASGAYHRATSSGFLKTALPLDGIYRVESFRRGDLVDNANADDARWTRIAIEGYSARVQLANGRSALRHLDLDEKAHTLSVYTAELAVPKTPQFKYTRAGKDGLRLEGTVGGVKTAIVLKKEKPGFLMRGQDGRFCR